MRKQIISDYIFLGTSLRYLQDVGARWLYKGDTFVEWNIDQFISNLNDFSLTATGRASVKLRKFREKMSNVDEEHVLSKEEADELQSIMKEIRPTLLAELGGMIAYVVSDKRYRVEHLLEEIYALFGEDYVHSVPLFADNDFQEAGRCIAFERPTAAAFHLLRGTESVLREYYCHKIKRNRSTLTWGPMVTSLRAMRRNKPPTELLDHLDGIRRNFRNPTAHPEKVYDTSEAQDLLGVSIDVVNWMCRELPQRSD